MKLLKNLASHAAKALTAVSNVVDETRHKMDRVVARAAQQYDALAQRVEKKIGEVAKQADEDFQKATESAEKEVEQFGKRATDAAGDFAAHGEKEIDRLAKDAKEHIAKLAPHAGAGAEALERWGTRAIDKLARQTKGALDSVRTLAANKIAESRAAIENGFQVARSRIVGAVANTANVLKAIYVNTGCWGGGHSDFVLVAGRYVVVCSWIADGVHRCRLRVEDETHDQPFVDRIMKFLDEANGLGHAKPAIHMYDVALTPLTTADEPMLLLLGDLHVNLFKESPFDTFTLGTPPQRKSLLDDFRNLLDHAQKYNIDKNHIIQSGDCFDVWSAQILLDLLCDLVVVTAELATAALSRQLKPILDVAGRHSPETWKPLVRNLAELPQHEQPFRQELLKRLTPRIAAELILSKSSAESLRHTASLDTPLDFTDATRVEQAISDCYENVWERFTRVRGNHDNALPNEYLHSKYGQSSGSDGEPRTYTCGPKDAIIVEHGEILDEFNKPLAFAKPYHGFEVARIGHILECAKALASVWGAALWDSDAVQTTVAKLEGGGDAIGRALQQFCRARAFDLRMHGGVSPGAHHYRLVALGHSHIPEITPDRVLDEVCALTGEGLARAVAPVVGKKFADVVEKLPVV